MAPPPGIVEVRCAGCGETLEVEPGLTEFACPDCGTHQALPPELMPRRNRRALPIPGRCAPLSTTPSRIACGGCSAVLSVPHGQGRFACPLCGAELAVSPIAAISVVAPPAAVPITPSRLAQPSEVCSGPSSQLAHARYIQKPIHLEQAHGQRLRHSFREEAFTSSRADTGTGIPVVGRLQNEPADPLSHREESHTDPLDQTIPTPSKKKCIFVGSPDSYPVRKVDEEHPNQAMYASEAQGIHSNSSVHTDKAEYRFPNDTVTVRKKKVGDVVAPPILEWEQTKSLDQALDKQQADEISKNSVNADKVQVDFASKAGNCKKSVKVSKGNQKRSKILMNSSNELPQLRRSRRLVKGSHDVLDINPIEKVDASVNQNLSDAPEIERTLADSDPSSPTRYQFPHDRSDECDGVDATRPPVFNDCTQAEQFPRTQMYSPDTSWALPIASSNSWHDREIPQESFGGTGQLDRAYSEMHSNPAEMQNQDMDGPLVQEICSDKNRSGHVQLKHHNKNHSEHGRQKRNGFTAPSNSGGHPEDLSFSGTCLQNLSASCSHLAASLPFAATITLPTSSSPSSYLPLNSSSPTSLHQQLPSALYSQDAPCGNLLAGSTSNSSKKRRGRAPEKLMEPRKEAERPVLIPSGTDWIVQPPCPKVANTLSLLIKQNYPGIYVSDDTIGNGQSCEHVVYHWHQCPPDTRTTILDEFLRRYRWSPGHEEECQKIFDRKAVRQLMNLFCYEKQRVRQVLAAKKAKKSPSVHRAHDEMKLEQDGGRENPDEQQGDASVVVLEHEDPLKWKPFVPVWMKPKWWEMLCDHWAKDENIKMSYQQRKNRYSGKRPCDAACLPKTTLHDELVESFGGIGQLDRGYSEVHSNLAQMQNQDMDGPLVQEICSDKNRSGHVQLKHHNKSHSEHGRQKRNGFTAPSNSGGYPEDLSFSDLPLNCSSPTSLHQQLPSALYSQDAPCGVLLAGSTSNTSKKRRGRAPEKLMESRKEAERPVLIPSGTTDWIVQPPCPKVANTLSLLIKQNYPGIYISDDTIGNGQSCEHVVYHWHQCPPDTRTTILDEFLKRYKWSPGHEEECQKIFNRKAVRQLMNLFCYEKQRVRQVLAAKKAKKSPSVDRAHDEMMLEQDGGIEDPDEQQGDASVVVLEHEDPLKWKPFVPVWMEPKWWEMLCDHWAKDENIKMSYQQRKNRYSGKRSCDAACSPKKTLHDELVDLDNGGKLAVDIDSLTNILREAVDQRACQTEDTRDRASKEAQSIQLGSHSVQRQAGSGKQRGHCDAIRVSKKSQREPSSTSSPVCVSKQGQQAMFTKEQVQDMINQALQGSNEAWEKKMLSLEQKMASISSSHIVPNGVKESPLAVRRSKQCKLARQDTLDSMDTEDPDAEDDSDYQDEEEHSS